MLFDWMVIGQVLAVNPAHAVRGPKHTQRKGITGSTDFPLVRPFQSANKGGPADGFVTKLNPQASQLIYSTYLGGSGLDYPFRIAVDRHEVMPMGRHPLFTDSHRH
jgi:hypothetical protein